MLIDLLSMDNYIQFNIKIAQLLGLHTAVYLSELLNINEKAVRKDKIHDDIFVVDRAYIEKRTTLAKKEQIELDSMLLKLGVLKKVENSEDSLMLDLSVLTAQLHHLQSPQILLLSQREHLKTVQSQACKSHKE